MRVSAAAATDAGADNMKTIVQKTLPGDVPFPWSEKDPYRLPVSIDRVQKMLITLGEWRGGTKRQERCQSWQGLRSQGL